MLTVEKGYQMFIDVKEMPKEYEHLQTRLRIEQSRCLYWGEKIGLVEEMLDEPSKLLQLNHNLVLDILHQIQTSFRSSLEIGYKYDAVANPRASASMNGPANGFVNGVINGSVNGHSEVTTKRKPLLLQKTLNLWEKGGRVASKVEWAMIKKGGFEKLITRLIQYNDRMESFLDRNALEDVRLMQAQSNLTMLQMADKVEQVRALVEAMHIARIDSDEGPFSSLSRAATLQGEPDAEESSLVSLAVFKAHHMKIEMNPTPGEGLLVPTNALVFNEALRSSGRQSANLRGRHVWVEWRESVDEGLSQKEYRETVEGRVKKLAAILTAPDKPKEFRSPQCVGYCQSQPGPKARYGLVYEWPPEVDGNNAEFVSLRQLLVSLKRPPTLNARVAKMLAASLLYLHAVNWIHKDIRSENVLFASGADRSIDLAKPLLSGFEFSRPALPEAVTVPHQFSVEHDLYRHPDLLREDTRRSLKSHDIYSLGLVLAEIALWQPVETVTQIEVRRRELAAVRSRMLGEKLHILETIDERAGWTYTDVIRDCVEGGSALNLVPGMDEEDPSVGAELSNAFYQKVVQKLQSIKM